MITTQDLFAAVDCFQQSLNDREDSEVEAIHDYHIQCEKEDQEITKEFNKKWEPWLKAYEEGRGKNQ